LGMKMKSGDRTNPRADKHPQLIAPVERE